ncbi:hypothetical protein E4665_17830 [Sporolactobacillus shoreae]|uniref:Uncharacterized protein n=1 Tax=Sporolactobacillus shoreae TaxID=1465501 RepID=A0A4Z0GGF4_9BACL|nr:hypothetical protein [Sporolactobacillus shoreae]TGA95577.1 hypothetical protein E4665_17830 [Sporolactobacillus shoreae]
MDDARIQDIENELTDLPENYVPRKELEALLQVRDDNIADLEKRIDAMDSHRSSLLGNWPAWLGVIISILSLAIHFK